MHLLFLLLPPSPFFFCYCSSPLTGIQTAYHFAPTSWVSLSLKSHVVLLRGQVSASQTMVGITTIIAQEFLKTSSCPASHSGNLPWRSPRTCSSQGWWALAGVGRTARSHWRGWGLNRLWPHHPPWGPSLHTWPSPDRHPHRPLLIDLTSEVSGASAALRASSQ